MQSTEAATLDRKSGEAEGSAVRPSGFPNSGVLTQTLKLVHKRLKTGSALAVEGRISIRLPALSAPS
jgi:hypothetical protein